MKYYNHGNFISDFEKSGIAANIDDMLEWIAILSFTVSVGEKFNVLGYSNTLDCEKNEHLFIFEKLLIDDEEQIFYAGIVSKKI
ncbi:hypothetical protein HCB44_13390 [Listeria sp. FSL L7-0229]|uniref:hypothetical protein n=1 Tax=Listeria cossartiae TaxID=2838249 RepID=UPI0016299F6A|nr:hypothetical protein [Listeria cossartiae]MBC2193268.1 hypothetical protein [Listeria cossartiae subsp. cossartiae]